MQSEGESESEQTKQGRRGRVEVTSQHVEESEGDSQKAKEMKGKHFCVPPPPRVLCQRQPRRCMVRQK